MAKKPYIGLKDVKESFARERSEKAQFAYLQETFKRSLTEYDSFTDDAREYIGNELAQRYEKLGWGDEAGKVYKGIGNFEKAGLNFARAVKSVGRGAEQRISFLLQAAESYGAAGKNRTSKALYKEAGKLFKKQGREDAAADMFERAGDFNQAGEARESLGEIALAVQDYAEAGNLTKAQSLFDEYHSKIKDDHMIKRAIRSAVRDSDKSFTGIPKRIDRAPAQQLVSLRKILRQKQEQRKTLEHRLAAVMSIGIFGVLAFLSQNLTGYSIANLNSTTSNSIGIALLLGVIALGVLYFRKK